MKKFAKILGFLGFFVTLATAQIGTAWAERVECQPGYYLPRGETTCVQCPSAANNGGVGVFCSGGVHMEAPYQQDMGIEPCGAKQCSSDYSWNLTPAGASSPSECKGTCKTSCIHPNSNCPLPNTNLCEYDRTEQVDGEIECFGSCTPENTPTNYCDVTCPKTCEARCICPLDESQTGSCPGYDTTEMVTGVLACGASTGSCDVKHNIYGNPTANNGYCQQTGSCTVKCEKGTCPTGTTCDWDLDSHPQSGHVSGDDCVDDLGNVISPQQCDMINVVCSDPCQYWDGKECKTYSSTTTYKCGNNTVAGPIDAVCGEPYTINRTTDGGSTQIIDTSSCTPSGYRLQGWRLTIDYSPYDQQLFSDPEVPAYNRFNWQATTNNPATFVAEWEEDKLYIHYHRYGGNWVQSNPPADDKEAFTISELPLTKTWTLTRNNSTFLGWCDDLYYSHLSDATWLNSHCQGPSSYTIPNTVNSDVHLYAWWGCAAGYTLNNSYQCVANAIDVIYTCTSPDSNHTTINRSFSGDATVGVTYTIRSVGSNESDHEVNCSFTGYHLENNYQWKRVGSNPEELYSPGPMNSPWAYTTTQTFELSGDYWKPNTYRVLYKCGSIDGNPVSGGDTADVATYGQPYYVATNIYDSFINNCSEPNGYVVDHWTFEQNNTPRYVTGEQFNNPDGWNLPEDDHYFVAHWVQTGGALTLDPNGGSDSNPAILYTTFGNGVYLDSGRTQQMSTNSNGLTTNPSKSANVRLYPNGTGAYFQWNGSTVTYPANVNDNLSLDFTGFYNDDDGENNIKLCIGTDKFITSDGISIGSGYNVSESHTWYAHWDPRQIYLPIAERSGYDFLGWYDDPTNGNWISDGGEYYEVSGDIALYAHWGVACRSVSFDENGGTSTGGGNNNKFWKISGATGWYIDSICTVPITPNVGSSRPTKEHATFIGYDDMDSTPTVRIFNDLGAITTAGENWTITQNATLYAQYTCDFPYHLDTDPESDTYGQCVTCAAGEFYQDDQCKTCNQILEPLTGINGWTSRAPYNWSIKQCYRVCDGAGDTQQTCDVVNTVSGHNEMEQFLTGNLINGNTGKQISFYGNESATSGAFNTCNAATGVTNCPQGLLANPSAAHKLMAAAVDFYEKRDLNGTYEPNGKRYIVGGRSIEEGIYKLNNGFAWSQVVGEAQLSEVEPIISIIYPATSAPAAANPEHYTFSNYVYPANNPEITPVDSTLALTTSNAAGIISYAINLDPANNNMSPIINQNRNLYAQYTADPTYTLTYSCGDGGGTPSISPNPVTGIYAGARIVPAQPEGCTNYGNLQFRWWAVSNSADTHLAGDAGAFEWAYTENKTFTAIWGAANTYNITYLKMPTTNNSITLAGNTLEMPSNQSTSMPDSYTCNASPDTSISGVPRLKNANNEYIGEVVMWCTDSNLENCDLPLELSNAAPCADKNVYAKWECTDPRYHLNENEDDCVLCPGGDYWDPNANGGNGACMPCSQLGGGWTSIAGYNWGVDQCYRFCPSGKTCAVFNESTYGDFNIANVVQYNTTQIEFYGNHYTHSEIPDVCASDSDVKYCPKLLSGSAAEAFKPMSSPVTFKKKDNTTTAGTRHIIGNRDASHLTSPYYLTSSSGKIWSHIVGPGQYTGTSNEPNYTFIIYPTDAAPAPSDTANDPLFKGYYDAQTGGTQRVAAALGLTTTNATDIMGGMTPANQIMNRTLYPQYCATGEIWNESNCVTDPNTEFTVTYDCGEGQPVDSYTDPVTVGLNGTYTVLANGAVPNGQGGFVTCNLSGQGFNGWKFSGNGQTYTGGTGSQVTPWTYDNETMTATYRPCDSTEVLVDGVCYPKCEDKTCTEPTPQNLQSHCPTDHTPPYPHNDVTCSYSYETITNGYNNGDGYCRYSTSGNGHNVGDIINEGTCIENVVCNDSNYIWNGEACEPNTGISYTVQFKCYETDPAPISGYSFSVTYGQSITIPSNLACPRTGYSYSQWRATQYNNPATLPAGASTSQYPWDQTHDETFIADWNDGNVYHVDLHAYSCDDSTQTGTFGNSGVQNLWEKYGVAWYRTNVSGNLSNPITELTTQQLPTRSGWTFVGYNNLAGDARVRNIGGIWSVSPATLIQNDEDWCAIWSQCNPNEYWNSGVCVTCNTATNGDFPLGDANATSIYQCYRQCSICTQVCPQTEGVDYCEFGNNPNMNGNLYYPGTGTCQPNYEQNCPIMVLHCLTGYTPNSTQTECVPNRYTITLNSHRDSFYGDDSVPTALYTKFGTNGGIWLNQYYNRPMVVGTMLDNNPTKYATVILNGNGGSFQWNGYPVTQANAQANFEFNGFYNSVNSGIQYISGTDGLLTAGLTAAQQIPDNQTWHAQWTNGSITLPNATRDGYTFNGWWTLPGGGTFAGNAGSTYTPVTANPTLHAQWVNGVYYINYHDDEGSLFFNASTSHCTPTTYTYGTQLTISCQLTPTANSHAVFKGWCKTPGANCAATQTITSTDYGNKDYYAWWGCESGYNANNGICEPDTSALCPARTLPNNAHATFVSGALNSNGTECIYTLKCEACTGCNNNNYTCYTHDDSATNGGIFTVNGSIGDASVLNNVSCNATEYDVYYRCDSSTTPGTLSGTQATYGEPYYVESNGTTITCQSNDQLFNGWTFNGNNQVYYPGTSNYMINSWNYCNITPIFTASYGQCEAGQIYVPSLGKCRPSCPVPCTWAGYPANPAQCPTPQYPAGATCWYLEGNPAAQTGYVPEYDPNACLNPMTDATITPQTCNVDPTQDPICPEYQHWENNTCEWNTYYVTLDSNNGIEDSNFVSKLFEKYTIGWSRTDNSFTYSLNLDPDELPSPSETCKVFKGYFNRRSGGQQMIQADGYVSSDGYQPLPSTTITDNNQKWYAQYIDNPGTFTIKFRCSANGGDIYSYTVHMGDANLTAPAATVCSGVAFNQWKGSAHPEILLNTGSYFTWDHCFDEIFVPDVKAVYRVDLNANGGTFPSDDYQELWYAVDLGWYKNAGLTTQITSIPGSSLPTKQGSNFNGWLDSATQAQRGNFSGANWALPASISANETWDAQWGPCAAGQYWDNGVCRSCSEATGGTYPLADANATNVNQCYKICSICLRNGCPTVHGANCVYNPDDPSVQNNGKEYNNGTQTCVSNTNPTPNCPYMITDCDLGWVPAPDGQSCVEDEKHTITLESHIIHGVSSDPDVLYTWHNRGVYLYSNYTGEMRANQNPLSENPLNYAIVTFNLNGQGASLIWNGQTYTGTMNANVLFDYQGFWKSVNGSPRYIDVDGYINGSGIAAGTGYTDDATWHARWQSRTLGTISSSGNDLPVPTRPGFVFDGWYDLPMGGNQVDSSSLVNNDMTVYAHWSDVIYTVNLVSDINNCQPSNNTPTKLYEKYNVGWNRAATGTFDPNLTLTDNELPTPNAGYEFKGYYDALSGGDMVIRSDGRVEQEPNYTDNTHTWYARCGRPTGPFTITFRCGAGEDPLPNYTQSVQNGGTVRVPPISACSNAGYTFTSWMGDHNTTFTARGTEYMATWSDVYANEDFTPNWNNGNVYYVTLAQTDATEPGIEILYEKYDNGWGYTANGPFNVTRLSGSQLPRRSGYVFAGYKYNDVPMGYVSNGQWRLPDPTVLTDNNQVWEPDWSQCEQGEYWDGNKCYPCPEGFTDNPHAIGAEQCYGNCEYDCQDSGCPSTLPVGMQSCTPDHSAYPQWGIKYNRPGATCLPQGQQSLPICPNDIICNNGYDLVGTECRDNRYTIALNSNLYNDNGTLANPSTLYTWFNHGVYRDYNRTYMMTPDDYPLASGTPSTYATVTLNGNGAMFNWHNQYGYQLQDNVDFVFDGFYDTTGAAIDPVIGIDRYITGAGQSIGTTMQSDQTWQARWLDGSVDLPSISRDGYTFDGWWTECDGGTRVSMGNQTITVSGDLTLCAHWSGKSYTVTYNCDNEGGQGGSATDNQLAYQNESYTVRENFIPCHKDADASIGRRYHEFENWKFNLNSNTYWPGDPILWIFTDDNPTFNAHYKECSDGSYFDGSCKACPTGYDHSNINATSPQHCYKTCNVEIPCTQPVSDCPNEEGVLTCVYPQLTSSVSGAQYYGSNECVHDVPSTQYCEPFTIMCKPGYTPDYYLSTDVGVHCTKLADHEITLDANCGGSATPGQENLYTTENVGVYLNPARTNQYLMTISDHPLSVDNLPKCIVTATFNHCDNDDPNCYGATITDRGVNLTFNGYYKTASGVTQYTDARSVGGQLKSYITQDGMDDGKGYTTDATWYAHWNASQVGTDKWPTAPTRPGRCNITAYTFGGWWTDPQGGAQVYPETQISQNETWYAHWCESCTGSIEHGSCSVNNCTATIACDTGYMLSTDGCGCVLSPDTRFTLTYKPNGGTPTQPRTQSLALNETFTTLGGDTFSKSGEVLCRWVDELGATTYTFPDGVAELSTGYTYLNENDITLLADWVACQCTSGTGVQGCSVSVVNNACVPTVTCMLGYIPNGTPTCAGECNATCDTSNSCRQCTAGTYQDGNECKPCPSGFTSNAGATSCYGNTITIDWDENGGNAIPDGSCVYGQTFTLANAPSYSNVMQFLGWKLANDEIKSAGASVMCDFTHVGVYSGTTYEIQAQWNECQCSDQLNPHVGCQPVIVDDVCRHVYWCDSVGYNLVGDDYSNTSPYCDPKTFDVTYNCGVGATGTPLISADTATYDDTYIVKNAGGVNCQKVGFNFVGWLFDGDNYLHQADDRITWTYTSNKTFTAQYSQCAAGEVWVNGTCEPCTCSQNNWSSGVASCVANQASVSACSAVVTCETGYNNPQWSCNGATCSAQCDQIQSDAIYVCGAGATGTPPATETMNYGATHTVKTKANCGKSGHTFNGWHFTGTNGDYNPGATITWNYGTDQTFIGQWCENCGNVMNGSCSLDASVAGSCSYDCSCDPGYELVGDVCTAHPICNPSDYYVIYRPNGGMNNGVLGQQVVQNVTYGVEFTTKDGTIFTKENSIVTAWDHVDGGDYPELNHWYLYNTAGDTRLDAHWEQCTCTLGAGAESCGTLSTAGNACNWTNPVCQNGYVSPNMQCTGTGNTNCTLTCGECAEGEIIVDGQCVPCTCTTGTGAASCTPGATANNTCTAVGQCMVGYGNDNGNANVVCNGTNCVVSYNECGDGWVSNENCQCNECPANTYQSGNTCVPCQNGYTSPAGSSSADACVPGAHTIHYLSNNGANETYNQGVYYGQSFVTEGGTRFTKTNHIMTHWNVESGPSNTFTNGAATLSGNYVYNDATDTTLSAQWAQCTCDADGCTTYATNSNECACNASEESCPDGYIYGGCECNGTNCAPICTLGGSNANYVCGTGIGTGYSTYVNYGDTHTILSNTPVVGCYRDNSTFAGWLFEGDNVIYFDNVGATVPWNYTTDKTFTAKWCSNCPVVEHGTNLLTIPEPGVCRCDLTCNTGYHVANGVCEPNVYPNENGITYKPNGGTPNQNYTQTVKYDASFTTLDWSAEHYRKPRHIMTQWVVESGGAGTFDSGYANLGTEYTYKTDGATVLAADWTECAADKISLNNQCQQCNCTAGTGTTSCGTLSTDDDTCAWGPVSCLTGYVNPTLDCSDDTTNCTAYCTKCGNKQVEVNGACTDCECEINGDGVNSGCGFVSNNGNICNWNPTTCELGYGYPDLTCTETDHNNNCTASCTICEAGYYGPNGRECLPCPDGKTSLPGAKSKKECFIDPNSCEPDEHIEHGECVSNTRACSIPNATSAARIWNPAIGTYGPCTVIECDAANGYHESGNACVRDTCTVAHGSAESEYIGGQWECFVTKCDPGYEPSSDDKSCVECANRYVDGDPNKDVAVSSYVSGCEIAACMYQGQKYALQNGECVPICEDETDETGTKVWDDTAKKCVRTCKPGYKMW